MESLLIKGIDVNEIIKLRKMDMVNDYCKRVAQKELSYVLKDLALSKACTIKEFTRVLKRLRIPTISENLEKYLRETPRKEIKRFIKQVIIKTYESYGCCFSMHPNWKRFKKSIRYYYYYESANFLNVYKLKEEDLPLYISGPFESEENRKDLLKRFRTAG